MLLHGSVCLIGFLLLAPLPCSAAQQVAGPAKTAKAADGPASAELRALVKADQEDRKFALERRQPTDAELDRMREEDPKRLARVRELLRQDKVVTAEDFENAALLFQHGTTPDDYLIAHELTMVNALKRRGGVDNMLALTEDRFLLSVGRKQRFGSQGKQDAEPGEPQIQPTDEEGEFAVTDALRADLFMPPLAASKTKGPMAVFDGGELIGKRLRERRDPKWQAEQTAKPEARELAVMLGERERMGPDWDRARLDEYVGRIVAAYRADHLVTPEDYYQVGGILLMSSPGLPREDAARRLLLAHELAGVAALRGHKKAPRLWAETWDRFLHLADVGNPPRYGTVAGARPRVSETLLRILGVAQ